MNAFNARNAPPTTADLDGWTFEPGMPSYISQPASYLDSNSNEFGFDPPSRSSISMQSIESYYSPTSVDGEDPWQSRQGEFPSTTMQLKSDESIKVKQPHFAPPAISHHGQITPPRSISAASSTELAPSDEQEPPSTRKKRNAKVEIKAEDSPAANAPSSATRKRKNKRKITAAESATNPEDDKRKLSLEKNRLAAAKCRVNKREKTDQLQRDSHEKAVENTYLKQTIMQMREEAQQLQTMLISHSSSHNCKHPESIHESLGASQSDGFTNSMRSNHFLSVPPQSQNTTMRQLGHDHNMPSDYFQPHEAPALPDFNMSEFEVRTPMLE